jgi:hypothetical protein
MVCGIFLPHTEVLESKRFWQKISAQNATSKMRV